ncbi:hypothetical protein BV20DRAFT_974451 [Pilatotrama ljubarskyi]|nr:hypothetical protein BV20DRAFT_974451 [Pilatotrama ljubarskyi]
MEANRHSFPGPTVLARHPTRRTLQTLCLTFLLSLADSLTQTLLVVISGASRRPTPANVVPPRNIADRLFVFPNRPPDASFVSPKFLPLLRILRRAQR